MDIEEMGLIPEIARDDTIDLILSNMVRAGILQDIPGYIRRLLRCNDAMLAYELINSKAKLRHYLEADALRRAN